MKAIQIKLEDENGKIVQWSIRRDPRPPAGWMFMDHEGYERWVEGNWYDLVGRFKRCASNYNLTLLSELS